MVVLVCLFVWFAIVWLVDCGFVFLCLLWVLLVVCLVCFVVVLVLTLVWRDWFCYCAVCLTLACCLWLLYADCVNLVMLYYFGFDCLY